MVSALDIAFSPAACCDPRTSPIGRTRLDEYHTNAATTTTPACGFPGRIDRRGCLHLRHGHPRAHRRPLLPSRTRRLPHHRVDAPRSLLVRGGEVRRQRQATPAHRHHDRSGGGRRAPRPPLGQLRRYIARRVAPEPSPPHRLATLPLRRDRLRRDPLRGDRGRYLRPRGGGALRRIALGGNRRDRHRGTDRGIALRPDVGAPLSGADGPRDGARRRDDGHAADAPPTARPLRLRRRGARGRWQRDPGPGPFPSGHHRRQNGRARG